MDIRESEIAYFGVMELKGAEDSHRAGYKVVFRLGQEKDYEHFKEATKRRALKKRRGQAGVIYRAMIRPEAEEGWQEMDWWLLGWSMSHSMGATVAFQLDSYDDFRYFREQPALDADDDPASFRVLLRELDDQGEVVDQVARAKVEAAMTQVKGGRRSIHAARMCQDVAFQVYVAKTSRIEAPATEDQCAAFQRQEAGVESRALLDHNESAWRRFHANVEAPFIRWRESRTGQGAILAVEKRIGESDA